MNNPFDDINLAKFGIEDTIDHNVALDAGGGSTPNYFTREELIKHVAEAGLFDENENLTEQGRTYLLNDQGFLNHFPLYEDQEKWFASNGYVKATPSVESENNEIYDAFSASFLNMFKDDNAKSTDNIPPVVPEVNSESEPVHADGDNTDDDAPAIAPVAEAEPEVKPSLEQYILSVANISTEDISVPLTDDGNVPANINTQMAVIPLKDPTQPKTWSEHYAAMELEPSPTLTDDVASINVDEALNLAAQTNGVLAAVGFDLTTATEDFAIGTEPTVLNEIEMLQNINVKLQEREDQAQQIFDGLASAGGVDREMAERLEKLEQGIITSQFSLEQFGRYPTRSGYDVSVESTEKILLGAKVAGGAILFGMLIKLIMYIRDKLKSATRVSESNRDAIRKATQTLSTELIRIERDYSNELANDDKFKQAYETMAKQYKLRAHYGSTSLLEVNDGLRSAISHKLLAGKFNTVMEMLVNGDKIQQLTRTLVSSLQAISPSVVGGIGHLLSNFSSTEIIDPENYRLDLKFVGGLESVLGISSKGSDVERLAFFNDKYRTMLEPNKTNVIPKFNKLIEFKLDINGAYGFDDKFQAELTKALHDLGKLSKQAEVLEDASLASNRKECIEVLKKQIQALMRLTTSLIGTRESAARILRASSSTTKQTVEQWKQLFKGTAVSFSI